MPYIPSYERAAHEEGRQKGREEGREEAWQEAIALDLEVRFGAASKRFLPKIRGLRGVENLRALLHAIKSAQTLAEVRKLIR